MMAPSKSPQPHKLGMVPKAFILCHTQMDDMEKIRFYSTTNLNHLHEEVENCFQKVAFAAITRITEVNLTFI